MLKGGIFLDVENLTRNGGYGKRFRAVNELVEGQGATVVRANAYMAVDRQRENEEKGFGFLIGPDGKAQALNAAEHIPD